MKHVLLFLTILCCSAYGVRAQSQTISYQGTLANEAGMPVDSGTYSITVTFYSDENGAHPLWQDTYATEVRKGIFNIALGSNQALPKATDMDEPVWVGTRINGTAETRPLARLGTVPFAMNVADHSITASKLATDYVSQVNLDGQRVSTKGGALNLSSEGGIQFHYDSLTQAITADLPLRSTPVSSAPDYWGETGNTGTSVPSHFIGTTDNTSAFEIHLEDSGSHEPRKRVYHVELGTKTSPNLVSGYGSGESSPTTGN